ncbi:MAG TPA: hypothetical protein PLH43_09445 [Acetivibrio sp.]|uniref:hypothetical protein n=1 Tax=Acetivibrio sp. TaxID=1872092 RepID=UPI002CECCBCA|nr:hypothetical protein [Acetivibrio sp.]HOM03037.1 hypothetical protein [Acetivibrio sp.]
MAEIITTFDLQGTTTKKVWVEDNINYDGLEWNINDVVCVLTCIGPGGVFYDNDNFEDPDIIPAQSRNSIKIITIPLDPETDYTHPLKGNYTIKLTAKNLSTNQQYEVLKVYSFQFEVPNIIAKISSGPYTGKLKSEDITDYGDNIFSLTREHRIKYPVQLDPPIDDIVSSDALIEVTPIYTNLWKIIISTSVIYHNPDELVILWSGSKTFEEYVFGRSIIDMADTIDLMRQIYSDTSSCRIGNQEAAQKRLVIINTAWHLLNQAYMLTGDEEECDRLYEIIQNEVQYSGAGLPDSNISELVVPVPPFQGGGISESYEFENGLTESLGVVKLGGSLVENTVINTIDKEFKITSTYGGYSFSFILKNNNGIELNHSTANTQGKIIIKNDNISLEYNDLITQANSRKYYINSSGLVEADDYRSTYSARSLISKQYFDANNNWGNQVVITDNTLEGNGTNSSPLKVKNPFPGFSTLQQDYGYIEPTHSFSEITNKPTTLAGYGITDAVTMFTQLTDTPNSYVGHGGKFVKVKNSADGLEFVSSAGFVPDTGGTFTGQVTINTSNDYPLLLRQSGVGGNSGVPEAGKNVIGFQDGDSDYQGEAGIDASGNFYLDTFVAGAKIVLKKNIEVQGNIIVTGTVDGTDLSVWKTEYDQKSPNWDEAYSWGDHAGLYQPVDEDLTAIASLGFTQSALLRKTGVNTWTLDTNVYATEQYVLEHIISDHGSLSGLSDDDHPQYALADGSRCVFYIPYGVKQTGVAGVVGQMSISDDYLFICVVGGGAGVAIWKKIPLVQT